VTVFSVQLLSQSNVISVPSSSSASSSCSAATIQPCHVSSVTSSVHGKLPITRLATSQSDRRPRTLAKLLPQTTNIPHSSSSAAAAAGAGLGGGVSENDGQPEVRSSHNIVEKRYRMSINDKLGELRQLVDGKDSKVSSHVHSLSVCLSVCVYLCVTPAMCGSD